MNVEDLKSLLGWERIVEEQRPSRPTVGQSSPKDDCFAVYRILPSKREWPSINVVFGPRGGFEQLEFGAWDDYLIEGREAELSEILVLVDGLIRGSRLLIEGLDQHGRCHEAGLYRPDEYPLALSSATTSIKRTFFDSEPSIEPIDTQTYVRRNNVWLLRLSKEEIEANGGAL